MASASRRGAGRSHASLALCGAARRRGARRWHDGGVFRSAIIVPWARIDYSMATLWLWQSGRRCWQRLESFAEMHAASRQVADCSSRELAHLVFSSRLRASHGGHHISRALLVGYSRTWRVATLGRAAIKPLSIAGTLGRARMCAQCGAVRRKAASRRWPLDWQACGTCV